VSISYHRKIIIPANILAAGWIVGVVFLLNTKDSLPPVHHIPRMHRLYWFDEALFKTNPAFKDMFPVRMYTDINFNGNEKDDKIKLAFAELGVREIVSTNDTLRGLRFYFRDSATFGTFFSLLTILQENRAKYYVPVDGCIWFFDKPSIKMEEVERLEY
jgi:hypothetical protein